MESPWPSRNVTQGGFLKPAKAAYSKDTQDLIKLLMEESKLSMMQRKNINYHLRCGTPLPNPPDTCQRRSTQYDAADQQAYNIMQRARERNGRKRTLNSIIQSGAFDVERFVPKSCNREPCDRAKLRLQEIMSGVPVNPDLEQLSVGTRHKYRKPPKMDTPSDCIAQLLSEIYERADWLAEMEELGEGKKHRSVIHLQIASWLREIERLEKAKAVATKQ